MSNAGDWSGSSTPPLAELEERWTEIDLDENILNFEEDLDESRSKRPKRDDCDETEFTPLLHGCAESYEQTKCLKSLRLTAGYIKHGFLTRLLHNQDPQEGLFKTPFIKLFGWKFMSATALVEHREQLFYLLRQELAEFESKHHGISNYMPQAKENCWSYVHLRKQCSSFLLYIVTFILRNLAVLKFAENSDPYIQSWISFPLILKKDMDNLWQFLGPINKLPNSAFLRLDETSVKTTQLTPVAHWLHLHLELKWGILEVLTRLYDSQVEKCIDQLAEIEEKSLALVIDLIHISTHIKFSNNQGTTFNMVVKISPFLCPCIKELWVMMIYLLDFHSVNYGIKSFWSTLSTTLTDVLQGDKDQKQELPPPGVSQMTCKNPELFSWWLLVHVAQLYWYNEKGEYETKENATVPGNWILVQDLLRLSFSSKETKVQEEVSRCYLNCCLQISQHWHPNNDVVLLLWDYFHKKMNNTFHVTGQGLQGLTYARDMPYQWFEQVLGRCRDPLLSNENETSYHLFLRILASHLKKLRIARPLQGWKQLKGRFYSKFHKKRMEELSEQGLLSFFNLFLTLAHVGELEDASNKMMSFLDLLDFNSLDYGRKLCAWKGYFVMLFLYKSKRTCVEFIAKKVSGIFTDICRNYKECYKDRAQRNNTWSFISIYLECTQELLEYKTEELISDYRLIDEGLSILFPICSEKELQPLVNFTQSLLDIVSNELQGQSNSSSALAQALWQHIFPYIQLRIADPFTAQMYSNQMINLAVSFTLLSIDIPPAMSSGKTLDTFHNIVQQYGTKDSVASSSLMASPQALELIQSSNYQANIIHTWFRCCLQISSQDQRLQELTRIVFLKLPEIGNLIKGQRSVAAGNVETALMTFIRGLGEKFSSLELLAETVAFREKSLVYIGDVVKYIEGFLKQAGPADLLRLSYKVSASLVRDCPKIIYKKTQHDCILPQIIDQLLLPFNTKKQLPPSISLCIKLNLTEFLEGLASLDFRRDEFIKRKIKQIFATYFHVFNQKCYGSTTNSSAVKNPFLEVLKGTLGTNSSQDASDFRQFVITIIKENYLLIPGLTPLQLTPTLSFLVDLFSKTSQPTETARNTPLVIKNILGCLLACDTCNPGTEPPHIRKEATVILGNMLESCQKAQDITPRNVLLSLLRDFIKSNLHQVQGTIFKVLRTVAKFDSELVLALITFSKQAILECEKKRGVGCDTRLRTSLKSLLETLGEPGKQHMEDFS